MTFWQASRTIRSRSSMRGRRSGSVAGHIPGALNRPYAHNLAADMTWKSAAQLREEFGALLATTPPDKVVNHCGSGVTAGHNILAMEIAGLAGSRLYPDSWSEWVADPARPVARGESY